MKNLSKKLLMSVVAVTLVVLALGTSTFAWFTLSNKASVGQFEAQVTSGEGIEIRIKGDTNWYTDIPASVMKTHIDGKTLKFSDITSLNGTNFSKFRGSVVGTDYYEVIFEIKSTKAMNIYWTGTTLNGETPLKTWQPDVTFDYRGATITSATAPIDVDPSDGARISVSSTSATFVYEKATVAAGNTNMTGTNFTTALALPTSGSVDYYNAKNVNNKIELTDYNAVTIAPTFSTFSSTIDSNNLVVTLASSGTSYLGEITVRVWLEGWDTDTFNAILGQKLFASLKFEGIIA